MSEMLEAAARAVATATGYHYSGDSIIESAEENPRSAHFVAVARAVIDVVLPIERDAIIKITSRFTEADCDYRGAQDPETGEVTCSRESRGDTCLCVERMEVADAIREALQGAGMTEPQKDTHRAIAAAKLIIDGRDMHADFGAVLVTLEGLVSLILLAAMNNDPQKAAGMINEGLVPGVESRIALAASRR